MIYFIIFFMHCFSAVIKYDHLAGHLELGYSSFNLMRQDYREKKAFAVDKTLVSKQLYVTGKNNASFNILGYSSYKNYASSVEQILTAKIRETYNFALRFNNTSPSVLLSRTTPEKLVFLQLLHSFDLNDKSFTDFLIEVSSLWSFQSKEFWKFLDSSFAFPQPTIYQIIQFIAKENITLPDAVLEQIFFLNNKYKVFEQAAITGDNEVVNWLLIYGIWKDKNVDSSVIDKAWKNGKVKVIELLMAYGKINNQNLPKNIVNELNSSLETLLHVASRCGYIDTVNLILTISGMNINSKDNGGKSPLYRAVENNRHNVFKSLVVNGADIISEPLLALAVQKADAKAVKTLVSLGVPLDIKDENNKTPLFLSVERNSFTKLEALAGAQGPNKALLNTPDDFGDTLLHVAASQGFLDSVKSLVKLGAAINSKNSYGETPLHKAVDGQNLDVIKFLIESGSDVRSETDMRDTIMHYAASLGNIAIVKFLISDKVRFPINIVNTIGESPLYKAACSGKCEMLKFLVNNGGDISSKRDGFTMLHTAAAEGNEEAVICLLENGMDVDVSGLWEVTPLNLAASQGHVRIARKLLERNANPDAKTKNLWTPLHRAVINGHLNIIRLLKEYNASITSKTDLGLTPLILAVEKQKVDAAELIVSLFNVK